MITNYDLQTFTWLSNTTGTLRDIGFYTLYSGASAVWTLPAISTAAYFKTAKVYFCLNGTTASTVTIATSGGSFFNFNGIATSTQLILNPGQSCIVYQDGTNWRAIGLNPHTAFASADFPSITATLADVTGLTTNVVATGRYSFRAVLHVTADATGGHKYTIGGTATATSTIYQINSISNTTNANVINSRQTTLAGASGQAGATTVFTTIEGEIVVNAAGTLTVQFAQNTANGTSTLLAGSTFEISRIS